MTVALDLSYLRTMPRKPRIQYEGAIYHAPKNLKKTRKGDQRKIRIAKRLRAETTMTLKWIAQRLNMGTWTHVANRLYHVPV